MDGWEDWPDDFDDSGIQENELNSFNPVRYTSFKQLDKSFNLNGQTRGFSASVMRN